MSPDISERRFEEDIERALLYGGPDAYPGDAEEVRAEEPLYGDFVSGGYRKRASEDYDRGRCLIVKYLYDFILATQPKE